MEAGFGIVDSYPADVSGWWWLPGRDDHRVRATLTFDAGGRAELDSKPDLATAGWFEELSAAARDHMATNVDVIYGQTGLHQRPVSLVGCQVFGSNTGNSTLTAECRAVIDGLWIKGHDHKVFEELTVEIEHLTSWAGRAVFAYKPATQGNHVQEPVAWYWTPPTFEAHVGGGRTVFLEWRPTYGTDLTVASTTIRLSYKAIFRVKWSKGPVDLDEAWNTAIVLQDLLTFGTNRACAFIRMQLTAHKDAVPEVTDPSFPMPYARIHVPGRVAPNPGQKHLMAQQMTFGMEDVDFSEFLTRWFGHHRDFRSVLATLLGQRYLPEQYAEPRLSMVVAAAEEAYRVAGLDETFMTNSMAKKASKTVRGCLRADPRFAPFAERIGKQVDNRLALEERLLYLAAELGGDLADRLLGHHRRAWAKVAKDARNKVAHTSSGGDYTGYQQTILMLATRTVIEFALLQRLGFTTETLMKIADRHEACEHLPSKLDWLPDDEPHPEDPAHLSGRRLSGLGWPN